MRQFLRIKFILFLILSRNREIIPDLAPMLWHSFGTIAILLQEITNCYLSIVPPTLTVLEL